MEKYQINVLKSYRRRLGLTQEDVALILDISDGTVARHELGRRLPSLERALGYATLLGVSVAELFPELVAQVEAQITASLSDTSDPKLGEVLQAITKRHGALREDPRC